MKHSLFTKSRPLRVGTDCSGIEAPIVALQQLKIPFTHEFSCEIDKYCIATIKANFSPKMIFGDMKERKLKDIPDIDLYVCGFPCQPFSIAGKREGVRDPRGTIFWECLRVIRYKKPMIFVLENVRGLISMDKGETFKQMLKELENIRGYSVYWKVLNTADYGIPQSRKRVFIVGILKKHIKTRFEWPPPIPCRPLEEFVDREDDSKNPLPSYIINGDMIQRIPTNSIFINTGFPKHCHQQSASICPCITSSKATLYCILMKRSMNIKEIMSLQSFPSSFDFPGSKRQTIKQLGNSMSVNVLSVLLKSICQTIL